MAKSGRFYWLYLSRSHIEHSASRQDTMAKSTIHSSGLPTSKSAARIVVVCLLMCFFAGCASDRYHPVQLPMEFVASTPENAQTVDLTRLAAPANSSEFIDSGDVVEITISAGLSKDDTYTFPVRINNDGTAILHEIGSVQLAGLELESAEAAIAAAAVKRGLYRSPQITITMKRQRANRITVVGAVKAQGTYFIPRGQSNLLAALVAAGGLTADAGTDVEIRNPGLRTPSNQMNDPIAANTPQGVQAAGHSTGPGSASSPVSYSSPTSTRINLASFVESGVSELTIDDGSIVMVEKLDPKAVHVLGVVKKAGRYDFPIGEEFRVLDAISLAGGVSSPVANKVFVIRRVDGYAEPVVVEVSIREAKRNGEVDLLLSPGDVVSVEQTPATVILDAVRMLNFGVGASLGTVF